MHSIREMIKIKFTNPHVTIFHHYLSFPTVVLLKLLQYRPANLRWANIVVVMQITVVKAKIKVQ